MKKQFFALIILSAVLTGCTSQAEAQNTVIAETLVQKQTEEVSVSESIVPTEEEQKSYSGGLVTYEDYESFLEVFQKEEPEAYIYQIPEDCDYKILGILRSENTYRINFEDTDGSIFFLEIDFNLTYPTAQAFYEDFKSYAIAEDNKFNIETDRYLFENYADGGVAMYGITGEGNTAFALVSTNKREDAHEILKERYEKLKL